MKKVVLSLMGILAIFTMTIGSHGSSDSKTPVVMMMEHGDHGG